MGNLIALATRLIRVATDRGILIRTATTVAGLIMMVIGLLLFFREPIGKAAARAAKVAV